jgi:hypothetical protein
MSTWMVDSLDALHAMCADRKTALDISNETLDAIAGFPDRYAAKLLGPGRVRGFGQMSLPAILQALALRITAVDVKDAAALLELSRRGPNGIHILLMGLNRGYLRLHLDENPVVAARMRPKWTKRQRAQKRRPVVAGDLLPAA